MEYTTHNTFNETPKYDDDLLALIIEQNNHIIRQNNELLAYLKRSTS